MAFPIYGRLTPATDTLDQNNDVTPVTSTDAIVSISLSEYGNDMRIPGYLKATAYTDAHKVAAETIAQNVVDSIELIVRAVYKGGSRVYRPLGVARTSLGIGVTSHPLTYAHLNNVKAQVLSLYMPAFAENDHAAIVHPALAAAVMADDDWQTLSEYNGGKTEAGNMFNGQIGRLAGFRFFTSPLGKVYWGGGLAAQAATTISAAVAAGDTTVSFTADTSLAIGDFITVGTAETKDTETVQITAGTSSPFTIIGVGNTEDNTGFKFAHAALATAVEAQSVGAMVIVGMLSVGKVYSSLTGPNAKVQVTVPSTAIANRFTDFSWWLLSGWGRIAQRYVMRAEFPLPTGQLGYCEQVP